MSEPTTHFGERIVPLAEKQGMVDAVFHGVADRYDLMNDLMSLGVHRIWKDAMVANLAPPKTGRRPYRVLDMAGGTGDIAERILDASAGYAAVTVADINSDMLRVGAERARKWRFGSQAKFVEANAEALPFPDGSFDAYTIAFGIRNVPQIDKALAEAYRVLKRGGRFLCLEFSAAPARASDDPESFTCRFCLAKDICHRGAWPRQNCRTCLHSSPGPAGSWFCEKHGKKLSYTDMQAGCGKHRFIPGLVPGEQVDVLDGDLIVYRLASGEQWIDGMRGDANG